MLCRKVRVGVGNHWRTRSMFAGGQQRAAVIESRCGKYSENADAGQTQRPPPTRLRAASPVDEETHRQGIVLIIQDNQSGARASLELAYSPLWVYRCCLCSLTLRLAVQRRAGDLEPTLVGNSFQEVNVGCIRNHGVTLLSLGDGIGHMLAPKFGIGRHAQNQRRLIQCDGCAFP